MAQLRYKSERTDKDQPGRFTENGFRAGGVHRASDYWKAIHVSPFVSDCLDFGYSLPFSNTFWSHLKESQSAELNFRERATVPWEDSSVPQRILASSLKIPKLLREIERVEELRVQSDREFHPFHGDDFRVEQPEGTGYLDDFRAVKPDDDVPHFRLFHGDDFRVEQPEGTGYLDDFRAVKPDDDVPHFRLFHGDDFRVEKPEGTGYLDDFRAVKPDNDIPPFRLFHGDDFRVEKPEGTGYLDDFRAVKPDVDMPPSHLFYGADFRVEQPEGAGHHKVFRARKPDVSVSLIHPFHRVTFRAEQPEGAEYPGPREGMPESNVREFIPAHMNDNRVERPAGMGYPYHPANDLQMEDRSEGFTSQFHPFHGDIRVAQPEGTMHLLIQRNFEDFRAQSAQGTHFVPHQDVDEYGEEQPEGFEYLLPQSYDRHWRTECISAEQSPSAKEHKDRLFVRDSKRKITSNAVESYDKHSNIAASRAEKPGGQSEHRESVENHEGREFYPRSRLYTPPNRRSFRRQSRTAESSEVFLVQQGTKRKASDIPDSNRQSARRHRDFVNSEVKTLLDTRAVSRLPSTFREKVLINPLSVAENGKKPRLILDLSYLNQFLEKVHFKLDDLQKIAHCLPENGYMCSFDFRSGYHHVLIAHAHRRFLAFEWDGELFWFNALPFGLSSAPFLFTKLLRPWVKAWRERLFGFAIYLDDGLIWGRTENECHFAAEHIRTALCRAGFSFSEEKCEWQPTQICTWLGFVIDLRKFDISLKPERWEKAQDAIETLQSTKVPSLRERMIWTGTLASLHLLISPSLKRRLKATQIRIAEAQERQTSLGKRFKGKPDEKAEWDTASDWLSSNPHRSLKPELPERLFNSTMSVDASDTAVGAIFHIRNGHDASASRELPQSLLGSSSTLRELFAIEFGLKTFSHRMRSPVLIRSDSQAAVAVFNKGSLRQHLQKAAEEAWSESARKGLKVTVTWVPREENVEADLASREFDEGDWRINIETCRMIQRDFNFRCESDLFANDRNAKTSWFVSKGPCPGSHGCDAFHRSEWWCNRNLWLIPPVHLVPQTLAWMRSLGSRGILGAPFWSSQPYYPMLRSGDEWNDEVRGVIVRKPGQPIFDPQAPSQPFGAKFSRIFFAFFLLDFSENKIPRKRILHLSPPAFVCSQ